MKKLGIETFLANEAANIMQLMQETESYYGRKPAEIVVGPPVAQFGAGRRFMDIPLRWDVRNEGGQVLCLMAGQSVFDVKAAEDLGAAQHDWRARMVQRSGKR